MKMLIEGDTVTEKKAPRDAAKTFPTSSALSSKVARVKLSSARSLEPLPRTVRKKESQLPDDIGAASESRSPGFESRK